MVSSFYYRATRSMHGIGMERVQIETKMSVNSWRNFQVKSVQRLILMLGGLLHIKVHSDICTFADAKILGFRGC